MCKCNRHYVTLVCVRERERERAKTRSTRNRKFLLVVVNPPNHPDLVDFLRQTSTSSKCWARRWRRNRRIRVFPSQTFWAAKWLRKRMTKQKTCRIRTTSRVTLLLDCNYNSVQMYPDNFYKYIFLFGDLFKPEPFWYYFALSLSIKMRPSNFKNIAKTKVYNILV